MKKRIILVFALSLAMTLVTSISAIAATYIFNYSTYHLAGITWANPQLKITTNTSSWVGGIKSYTSNPVYNIDRIGWWWWTRREWCNGTITYNYQSNGAVEYNASTISSSLTHSYHSCPGTREVSVATKQDFAES